MRLSSRPGCRGPAVVRVAFGIWCRPRVERPSSPAGRPALTRLGGPVIGNSWPQVGRPSPPSSRPLPFTPQPFGGRPGAEVQALADPYENRSRPGRKNHAGGCPGFPPLCRRRPGSLCAAFHAAGPARTGHDPVSKPGRSARPWPRCGPSCRPRSRPGRVRTPAGGLALRAHPAGVPGRVLDEQHYGRSERRPRLSAPTQRISSNPSEMGVVAARRVCDAICGPRNKPVPAPSDLDQPAAVSEAFRSTLSVPGRQPVAPLSLPVARVTSNRTALAVFTPRRLPPYCRSRPRAPSIASSVPSARRCLRTAAHHRQAHSVRNISQGRSLTRHSTAISAGSIRVLRDAPQHGPAPFCVRKALRARTLFERSAAAQTNPPPRGVVAR